THAQQSERLRRGGGLMKGAGGGPGGEGWLHAFLQRMQKKGRVESRNIRGDKSWGAGKSERLDTIAAEQVRPASDRLLPTAWCSHDVPDGSDPLHFDRIRANSRSCGVWLRSEPGQTGRQHHWIYLVRIQHWRKMVGITQTSCATFDTGGCPTRPPKPRRHGPV